jgi:DNA-binding CsgD family transcriptional regulator
VGAEDVPNVISIDRERAGPRMSRRMAEICADRMQGLTYREIAELRGLSVKTVGNLLYEARQRAHLRDVPDLLTHAALPLAVDNLVEGLREGDQKYTLATLKGLGAFAAHAKQEQNINANAGMTLTLKVEMPEGRELRDPETLIGEVVGLPRELGAPAHAAADEHEGTGDRDSSR